MIAYEDLCHALDRYNRRLRGEVVPETPPPAPMASDDYDIMDEAEVEAAAPEFGADFGAGVPDITAETQLPEAGYDPAYQQQQGYDPAYQQQQGYDPAYQEQPQGYESDAYPQNAPPVPGSGPVPGAYPEGYDPNRQ